MNRFTTALLRSISFLFLVVGLILLVQNIDQLLYKQTLEIGTLTLALACLALCILGQRKLKKSKISPF